MSVAWFSDPPADVAFLAPSQQLSPAWEFEPTTEGIYLGQQVYFLGFVSLDMPITPGGFPMPLVRSGVLAAMLAEHKVMLVDGHNVPGFSGGPVVFKRPGENSFRVAGVISAYRSTPSPVFDATGQDTGMRVRDNTGLIIAYFLREGVEHVKANPSGFVLAP